MMKKRLIMLAVVLPLLLLSCDENEMGGGVMTMEAMATSLER